MLRLKLLFTKVYAKETGRVIRSLDNCLSHLKPKLRKVPPLSFIYPEPRIKGGRKVTSACSLYIIHVTQRNDDLSNDLRLLAGHGVLYALLCSFQISVSDP
jgi:hypothetical protein